MQLYVIIIRNTSKVSWLNQYEEDAWEMIPTHDDLNDWAINLEI